MAVKFTKYTLGFHLTTRSDVAIDDLDAPIKFPVVEPESLRFPGALFTFSGVTFAYSRNSPVVLENVNLTMHPGDRVGLMGKNGQGKSTLVKLLMGHIAPSRGAIERHARLKLGYVQMFVIC
jgi:ATP-binding cassette, subfamily F, member 3